MTSSDFDTIAQMLADSQKGYAESAEIADDPQVKQMFADRAQRRQQLLQEIRATVPRFGMNGDADGTTAGAAHRAFLNLRRLVQDDTRVALAEVERGEAAFLERLQEANADNELTSQERQVVGRLLQEVSADHDRFASMKAMF